MTATEMRYYLKFLTAQGEGTHSHYRWPLPTDGQPGAWVEVEGELAACKNGIHACRLGQAVEWADDTAYLVEYDGEPTDIGDKVIGHRARLARRIGAWNWRAAQLWAADCAERVLPLYEAAYPGDGRVRAAIEARRQWARGELDDAVWDAARAAAWDAAWAAVGAAAWAAARDAVWAAARDAARDAASAAARDAASAAAWAAASAAARDAANAAARAAARAVANAAAWDAANAAARDAERRWQSARLAHYLGVDAAEVIR